MNNQTLIREMIDKINNFDEYKKFLEWKRKYVTLRGIKNIDQHNNMYGSFGNGLYTTPLSNKTMARQYGDVYFVVNAKPKKPKIVPNLNDAEILRQRIIHKFCEENNHEYSQRFFEENSSMDQEMIKMGYDGLVIKGREMVNYKPKNYQFFKTEKQLFDYFSKIKQNEK